MIGSLVFICVIAVSMSTLAHMFYREAQFWHKLYLQERDNHWRDFDRLIEEFQAMRTATTRGEAEGRSGD